MMPMSVESFVRLRLMRGGQTKGAGVYWFGCEMWCSRRAQCLSRVRYQKVRLYFASVEDHIAQDKIAETISGYLYARDADGLEVRRPARRWVAYRMLKEFGEGNVFLALRESVGRDAVGVVSACAGGGRSGGGCAIAGPEHGLRELGVWRYSACDIPLHV